MRRQNLRQDVHEERGADQTQKNPHWPPTVRLFGVWEKVWTTGSPEEAHEDTFCPGATLSGGRSNDGVFAVSSTTVSISVLEGGQDMERDRGRMD